MECQLEGDGEKAYVETHGVVSGEKSIDSDENHEIILFALYFHLLLKFIFRVPPSGGNLLLL